jgi:predicted ATPase/DNA-binding SARP family transcriptional activator
MTAAPMPAAHVDRSARYLAAMEIRLLGPIEVYDAGVVRPLGGMRERALLALLALSAGQVVSTDRLIEDLWGEALPVNPANALQALVSRLRRAIGSDAVVTKAPGYLLDVPADAVDVFRFRSLAGAASGVGDATERSRMLGEALALWHGEALAELAYEDFARREGTALEELRLTVLEGRIAADLESGVAAELVAELDDLVGQHPLREGLRSSQMLALYRSGRQADALRAYGAAREVLGEELGIEPGPELRELEEAILMQDPSLMASPAGRGEAPTRRQLPARLASFVGRSAEMEAIDAALTTSRLVTLTGAGGAGKTSLAIEAARARQSTYRDGVWLVELAPVVDPARVPDALLMALDLEHVADLGRGRVDVDPIATVVDFLRDRQVLLVLDNCEQVVDAAAAAAEAVLLACPAVEVLATSRDRLGIPGELLWRVPSLALSAGRGRSEAAMLFLDRAMAISPTFAASPANLEAIEEICRRVDGIPLAIELAAARSRSLPVSEIARRLETGIGVLSGGSRAAADRQRTLQTTIDWSHQLLAPDEREVFAALAVFHGSFTLQAAAGIAPPGEPDVLDRLERLIDTSMLTASPAGETVRYRMLEPLRLYAAEKLAAAGATDVTMDRLIDYFLETFRDLEDELRGPQQLEWLEQVEADHGTLRSLLDWAATHAPERGLQLASMLGWFWYLRGSGGEARERLQAMLTAAGDRAAARWRGDGWFFLSLHDPQPDRSRPGFETALAAYREAGYERGAANATAMLAAWGFNLDETIALLEQSSAIYTAAGDEWGIALARFLQAGAAMVAGDNAASLELAQEAARRFAAVGDRWGQGYSLYSVGVSLRAAGRYEEAEAALRAALDHARPMRLRREMAPVMCELASIATMRGDYAAARQLLDEAQAYADEIPFAGSRGMVANARGRLARVEGDLAAAQKLHRKAVDLYTAEQNPNGLAYSRSCLGLALEMAGDIEGALAQHRLGLESAGHGPDGFAVAFSLEGIGAALVAAADCRRGVELVGAGLQIRVGAGTPLPVGEHFDVDRVLAAARQVIGAAAVDEAMARGRTLDIEAAIALAAPTS